MQHQRIIISCTKSFSFVVNSETIDVYVTHIRQVGAPLGYGETTNFRGVKEHTPYKIVLDTVSYRRHKASGRNSYENSDQRKVRQAIDWKSSSTPFMSIRDGHNRKVSLGTK